MIRTRLVVLFGVLLIKGVVHAQSAAEREPLRRIDRITPIKEAIVKLRNPLAFPTPLSVGTRCLEIYEMIPQAPATQPLLGEVALRLRFAIKELEAKAYSRPLSPGEKSLLKKASKLIEAERGSIAIFLEECS